MNPETPGPIVVKPKARTEPRDRSVKRFVGDNLTVTEAAIRAIKARHFIDSPFDDGAEILQSYTRYWVEAAESMGLHHERVPLKENIAQESIRQHPHLVYADSL